ncbi:MAG: site-specific integrase [Phycisphaerae bacterium]|nr:site-specific integrase [Phycisphaerae bacterium]
MAHLYKRGNRYWICYYVNGEKVQGSLRTDNARIAKDKQRKLEYELALGDLHQASQLRLDCVLEEFCQFLRSRRTFKSYKNDISKLRVFFGPICDSLKLSETFPGTGRYLKDKYENDHVMALMLEDISFEMINKFLTDRVKVNKWSAKTVNNMRQILHRFFSYTIKHHGYRSRDSRNPNPVDAVERMRVAASDIRFLCRDEIDIQLEVVKSNPRIYAMVATYIYAGLRREEAVWLTDDDVDFEKRMLRLRAKCIDGVFWQPKTKKNRAVPISKKLFEILLAYKEGPTANSNWFFPSPKGKRWDVDNFSHDLRNINKKNGLVWNCLDFRHTFGSHLAQKGVSLYKIAEIMGNSPDICRKHYAALRPELMADVVEFEESSDIKPTDDNSPGMEAVMEQLRELKALIGKNGESSSEVRLKLVASDD